MNRVDFMQQLESLLQSIAPMERDEALQYYNDYFDDAGKENEQEVIEALGNPARVAENIKRDLLNNGYGEGTMRKARASDRALVEYEKEPQEAESEEADNSAAGSEGVIGASYESGTAGNASYDNGGAGNASCENAASENASYGNRASGSASYENGASGSASCENGTFGNTFCGNEGAGNASYGNGASGSASYGNEGTGNASYGSKTFGSGDSGSRVYGNTIYSQPTAADASQSGGKAGKQHMSGWTTALIVVLVVLASPVLLGVGTGIIGIALGAAGTLLGIIAAWFVMIAAFGVAFAAMFVVLVVLIVVGFLCLFTDPWVGMAMIGSGLVCGGIGLLFLMLTVAMAGIVTPAIFRGLGHLFRYLFKKSERGVERSLQRG